MSPENDREITKDHPTPQLLMDMPEEMRARLERDVTLRAQLILLEEKLMPLVLLDDTAHLVSRARVMAMIMGSAVEVGKGNDIQNVLAKLPEKARPIARDFIESYIQNLPPTAE